MPGGNVGIGATNPLSKLYISDTVNGNNIVVDSNKNNAGIALGNTSIGGGAWQLNSTGNSANIGGGKLRFDWDPTTAYRTGINGSTLMVLQSNGNAGIGTNGPGFRLSVNGNAAGNDGLNIANAGT